MDYAGALIASRVYDPRGFFIPLCASQYRNKEPTILENESGRLFCCLDWEHDPCPALAIGLVARLQVVRPHPQTKRLGGINEDYQNQRLLWHLSGNSCQR